ncbi:MAG: NADP-dependent oxidoreductase, partial [bacterium]|nr:NADP-dependent oxidoreductase [bacterium]
MNRRFLLAARPDGLIQPSDFALVDEAVPPIGPDQMLVRNHYA